MARNGRANKGHGESNYHPAYHQTPPPSPSRKVRPPAAADSSFNWRLWLKAAAFMAIWSVAVVYLFKDAEVTLNGETRKGLVPRFILTISCE